MHLHGEVHQKARAGGDIVHIQHHLVREGAVPVVAIVLLAHLAAHHVLFDDIGIELGAIQCGDVVAVTEHHHAVADLHQLLQVVGDEDDALILVTELAHDTIDNITATLRKSRGGLVHHQHLGVCHHHAGKLHQLTILNVQPINIPRGINIAAADVVQRLLGGLDHGAAGDHTAAAELLLLTQKDVLGNGDAGDIALLLHDHADAHGSTLDHGGGLMELTFIVDLTAGGRLHTCQNGGDGGLTGAVLADQAGDLSAVDLQIHMIQRNSGAKVFAKLSGFNDQLFLVHSAFHLIFSLLFPKIRV